MSDEGQRTEVDTDEDYAATNTSGTAEQRGITTISDSRRQSGAQPERQLRISQASPESLDQVVPEETTSKDSAVPLADAPEVVRSPSSDVVSVEIPGPESNRVRSTVDLSGPTRDSVDSYTQQTQKLELVTFPEQHTASVRAESLDESVSVDRDQPEKLVNVAIAQNTESGEQQRPKLDDSIVTTTDDEDSQASAVADVSVVEGELEELGEVLFGWAGGTPYTSRRPQVIIHEQRARGESLALLQRVLRDNYTFLEGGEPTAETASTRAGELQTTALAGRIVTLDLAESEFSGTIKDGVPQITLQQSDIVPELVEWTDTLYTGGLGYLIVSVPPTWNVPEQRLNFAEQLREYLSEPAENGPDVRVARPTTQQSWSDLASQYFGVRSEDSDTVREVEAKYNQLIEREDWRATALGKQSNSGDSDAESDHHYLIKSKLTETIAYQWYCESSAENYGRFLTDEVLEKERIRTEEPMNADDNIVPDLRVDVDSTELLSAIEKFCSVDTAEVPIEDGETVVVEYETGRQQGGFAFRKIRDTLDKYDATTVNRVLLVVPPAVLLTGASRAAMITRLVSSWNRKGNTPTAYLSTPLVADRQASTNGDRYGVDVTLRVFNRGLTTFYEEFPDD
jgi:hypothetical protein